MAGKFPRYAAVPFVAEGDHIAARMPVRCMNERAALACAERLLTVFGYVGAVALRRTSASSDRLVVLRAFGDVPRASDFEDRAEPVTVAR